MTSLLDFLQYKCIFFDFDGVILESSELKGDVFAEIFKNNPEHIPAIRKIHEDLGGISRYVKFDLIYRNLFKKPLSTEKKKALGNQFSEISLKLMLHCSEVPFVRTFLERVSQTCPCYIVSGMPEDELRYVTKERHIDIFFKNIFGSPKEKPTILKALLKENSFLSHECLFIGDAMTDYRAAAECGIPFLGRVRKGNQSPFPNNTTIISDFFELNA